MRVCPSCNNKIQNPKTNFCFQCGARLFKESDLPNEALSPPQKADTIGSLLSAESPGEKISDKVNGLGQNQKESDSISKKWNYFVISSNFLAILFLLASAGVFFRYNLKPFKQISSPLISINNVEVVDKVNISTDNVILKTNFSSVVPANALSYYESNNSTEFLKRFLDESQKVYLETTYDLAFEDLLIFLKPDFSYSRLTADTWIVITRAGGTDFFDRTYSLYLEQREDSEPVSTHRTGDFLVFSNDSSVFNLVDSIATEVELPLGKSPDFNSSKNKIEGDSFFFGYSTSQDYLDKNLEADLEYFDLESIYTNLDGSAFKAFSLSRVDGEVQIQTIN